MSQSTTSPSPVAAPLGAPRISSRLAPLLEIASAPDLDQTVLPALPPSTTAPRLRRVQALVVIALLALGAISALQLFDLRSQLASAPQLAAQYDRLAMIETDLSEAGNLASLRSAGAKPAQVTARLNSAAAGLVTAAAQRPGDQEALASLGAATTRYGALLLASPLSAQDITAADQILTTELLPKLATLRANLQTEAAQRSWSSNAVVLWAGTLLALGALVLGLIELARLSHRYLNVGVAVGLLAAIGVAITGLSGVDQATAADATSRETKFATVVAVSESRLNLVELRQHLSRSALAKAATAETSAAETALLGRLQASAELPKATSALLTRYRVVQAAFAKGAFAEATAALVAKETTTVDEAFAKAAAASTKSAITTATKSSSDAVTSLLIEAILVLVFTGLGATSAYLGVSLRLKEYR
jgi:hypothetical protein